MPAKRLDPDEVAALRGMGVAIECNRQQQRLSVKALARKVAIDERRLARIEAGETQVDWGTLRSIAYALDLTLPELIEDGERRALIGHD